MTGLSLIGAVCAAAYLTLLSIKASLSWHYIFRNPESHADGAKQGLARCDVTVMQPILSGDRSLSQTLRTNLETLVDAQFLWLVDDADALGRQITGALAATQPGRVQIVLCPDCPPGTNPKVEKLHRGLAAVSTEYVAVLDDDTMLVAEHLPRACASLGSCDLYTGLPHYSSDGSFWDRLLAHFVNNNSAVTYLPPLAFAEPLTLNGMFYVMKTATLRHWGGFQPIRDQLCDDWALARHIQHHGGRIRQGITSQRLRTHLEGSRAYFRQMHRWFVFAHLLVRDQPWRLQLMLMVLLGLPPLMMGGSLLLLTGGLNGALLLIGLVLVRHAILRRLQRTLFVPPPRFSIILSVISELLQGFHALHAGLVPSITWRSRRIRPRRDGTFQALGESTQ